MNPQDIQNVANAAAQAAADANFQLFQAIQQSPKALVMEEPRGPSQLVEIQVTQNGVARVPFPDVPNLRAQIGQNVVIKGARLITPSVLTNGPISGFVNAPLTELVKMSLVLYCEGWEKGQLIPLLTLNDMFTQGSAEPYRRTATKFNDWKAFDWSKTFIQLSNGTVTVLPGGANYVVCLDVEYIKLDSQNKPIIGPS